MDRPPGRRLAVTPVCITPDAPRSARLHAHALRIVLLAR